MRKLITFIVTFLLFPAICYSQPTRSYTYTTGDTISASEVTANEDNLYNYLQSGVSVYADGTIVNADVNGSANIQCEKLNVQACAQNFATTGTGTFTGAIATSAGVSATGLVTTTSIQIPFSATLPSACNMGQLYIDTDADTNGSLYICIAGSWKEVDDD